MITSENNKVTITGVDIPLVEKIKLAFQWFIAVLVGVGIPVFVIAALVTGIIESQ